MSTFVRSLRQIASFLAFAEVGNWFLAHVASFLHLGIAGILFAIAMMSMSSSSTKSKDNSQRIDGVVQANGTLNARVNNLSGHNTASSGLPDGTIGGHTDTAGLANGQINGSTGQINTGGGTAHTHGPGSLSVADGTHLHGAHATNGNLSVNNGVHSHVLPFV